MTLPDPDYTPPSEWTEAVDALRWQQAEAACPPASLAAFLSFARRTLRGETDVDPWKAACALRNRKRLPTFTVGIPSIPREGLDEPDPRLRAWAIARELLRLAPKLHEGNSCSDWLERLAKGATICGALHGVGAGHLAGRTLALETAVDGVAGVAWWLTGMHREAVDYFWVASAQHAASSLVAFPLLSTRSTQARLAALDAWSPKLQAQEDRKGDLVFFLRRARSRILDEAYRVLLLPSESEFAWQAYRTLHRLSRSRLRDDPDSRLGSWCARVIAAATLGTRISALPAESRLVSLLRWVEHRLLSEPTQSSWQLVPVHDEAVAFPLWRALRSLLRSRVESRDDEAVEQLCTVAVQTDSLCSYSAKYVAHAAFAFLRSGLRDERWRREQSRRLTFGLLAALARRKGARRHADIQDTREKLFIRLEEHATCARPDAAAAEIASAVRALREEADWLFDTSERDVPREWTGSRCLSLLSACDSGADQRTPSSLASARRKLRERLNALDRTEEDRVVDQLLWPETTTDWFRDDAPTIAVPHNLPPVGTDRHQVCRDATRSYLARLFSPLSVPEPWFTHEQFPHLFEDLRHLVGSKSCAQGDGTYNLSLGNLVLLLGLSLARGVAFGRPVPVAWESLMSSIEWTEHHRRCAIVPAQSRNTSRRIVRTLVAAVFEKRTYRDHAASHECLVHDVGLEDEAFRVTLDFSCATPTGGERSWLEKVASGADEGISDFRRLSSVEEDVDGRVLGLSPLCLLRLVPVDEGRLTLIEIARKAAPTSANCSRAEMLARPVVLVVDTDAPRRTQNVFATRAVAGTVLLHTGERLEDAARPGVAAACPPAFDLALVHDRDSRLLEDLPKPKAIVHYTGGAPPAGTLERWVPRPVTSESPLRPSEVDALISPAPARVGALQIPREDRVLLALLVQAAAVRPPNPPDAWFDALEGLAAELDVETLPPLARRWARRIREPNGIREHDCREALGLLKPR